MINQNIDQHQTYYWCNKSMYMELLLYIIDQSTYISSIFVYLSYSKCDYITKSDFDIYYILFVLSALNLIFYKYFSSISILMITGNCKHFILQWFDLLIIHQCLSNSHKIKGKRQKLWIQQYLLTFHSIFGRYFFSKYLQIYICFVFLQFATINHWNCICIEPNK